MIDFKDTLSLIAAAEQIKPPASFLIDTFFPIVDPVSTSNVVAMEYRKTGREQVIPFVVEGSQGTNVERAGSKINFYQPPMVAPRRILTSRDVTHRTFGETPVYSTMTPEQRAAKIQADDLRDLIGLIQNKKEIMAAEVLTTGKINVSSVADDGVVQRFDEIDFDTDNEETISVSWATSTASIFDDIQTMSEKIQEDVGIVPTVMICGSNVPKYLRKNKELLDWLMIPSRENMVVASITPQYVNPQVQWIGRLDVFNLEVFSYSATYMASDGTLKPFLDPDDVIIGVPGRGRQLHAAVTLVNDIETGFQQYAAQYVPSYSASKASNAMTLTVYSRFVLVPDYTSSWRHARVVV